MQPRDPVEAVLAYHDRTKHAPMRFARSLGYLDWENQPDPFRRYEGARKVLLPLDSSDRGPSYDGLYHSGAPPENISIESLGRFFELSLAITAWKSYQTSTWALRANPSSGNLHPTEGYCIIPEVGGIGASPGVYHYRSVDHALEERCIFTKDVFELLLGARAKDSFFVGLSSIHWREAWKYGERAYRYCQHDVGHAIGSLRFAAACLGWRLRVLPSVSDDEVSGLLGLDRASDFEHTTNPAEREEPDLLAIVETAGDTSRDQELLSFDSAAVLCIRDARWSGRANRLSTEHVEWDVIDAVAASAKKVKNTSLVVSTMDTIPASPALPLEMHKKAARVIRDRRSATAYDGKTHLSRDRFFTLLDRALHRPGAPPFDSITTIIGGEPAIHLAIFIHRVEGLERGLYFLVRNRNAYDRLRAAARPSFPWSRVEGAPEHLPLYLLKTGDMTAWGASISCNQDIAGDGVFSLGMIAEFEPRIARVGAHAYRILHWEAGLIGQVLYLELEAAGIRGTGIGCFYDDEMHGVLGFRDHEWHTIYHFAAGGPVLDGRLQTKPPYNEGARLLTL